MKSKYKKMIKEAAGELNEEVDSQLRRYSSPLMALRFLKSLLCILLVEYIERRRRYFYRPEFWFIINCAKKKRKRDKKNEEQDEDKDEA